MTGEIGAAGDMVTGLLVGRAMEPHAGEGGHGGQAHGSGLCLNCGTRLLGAHCHACGQSGHVHRTLGAIGHEIAHGVFHFEGKIWRTLPMLVLHPGTLTRRYIDGERARFVSPLALFLFTVFLMFATISAVGGEMYDAVAGGPDQRARAAYAREVERVDDRIAAADKARTAALAAKRPVEDMDRDLAALRMTRAALKTAAGNNDDGFRFADIHTGWDKLDHGIDKANANPGLALYKLQTSAYKYSWVLIPLSTPFVAMLFLWRRRFGLYDHAIFVTYSIAFMMLMVIALILAGVAGLPGGWITLASFVIPPIHMFAQLRGAYGLRKRSAAWRLVALVSFAFTALTMFLVLLLLHGLTD